MKDWKLWLIIFTLIAASIFFAGMAIAL